VHNLNPKHVSGYTEIIEHVINRKGRIFFVDGPGGTNKTFLYSCLIATVHSEGLIAVATATSGIEHQSCPVVAPLTRYSRSQLRSVIVASESSQNKVIQPIFFVEWH
jgi:hypothetical protein